MQGVETPLVRPLTVTDGAADSLDTLVPAADGVRLTAGNAGATVKLTVNC